MSIRISHVWPKIGIQTQKAKLNLKNNGKTDHIISHTNPQIEINSTNAKVHIDQSQCFADAGLKNIEAFAAENVQLAQKNVMEYIQKKVQLGDNCAKTYNKEARPILDSIRNEMSKTIDYNIGLMPEHAPVITVEEGQLDIQVNEGKVNVHYNNVPIDIEYIPAQIKIYMEQTGSISIEYVGNNVDTKV